MKICRVLLIFSISLYNINFTIASTDKEIETNYQNQCLQDLTYLRKNIEENSAPFKDTDDPAFRKWFDNGYLHTKELIDEIKDQDDCYYALKFYINGFGNPYMSMRSYIHASPEKYPGFLTAKYGNDHIVIYKDPLISSLNKLNIGNKVTHINDIKIEDY